MVFLIDHADLQDGFIPSRRCDARGIAALEDIYGEAFKVKNSGIFLYYLEILDEAGFGCQPDII